MQSLLRLLLLELLLPLHENPLILGQLLLFLSTKLLLDYLGLFLFFHLRAHMIDRQA